MCVVMFQTVSRVYTAFQVTMTSLLRKWLSRTELTASHAGSQLSSDVNINTVKQCWSWY